MVHASWLRASVLAATALTMGNAMEAQSDPTELQQKLSAQFKLTTITADRTDIVSPGDIVAIHRPGLVMYSVASPLPPSNSYKDGKIVQGGGGFGRDLAITMMAPGGATSDNYPHRRFVPEEKCWVTGIQVQKDGVVFHLYSDPYNDVRYYANIKIPFPDKKSVPSPEIAMQTVAEVLTVVPQDNQAGAEPAPATGTAAAASDVAASVPGKYDMVGSGDYAVLNADGTIITSQSGKTFAGVYRVDGEFIVLLFPRVPPQKCRLNGDTITDVLGRPWKKEAAAVPASFQAAVPAPGVTPAPAPMADIPPPPPPSDAPPPTIELGQTKDQVTAGFGQPTRIAKLGVKEIYYYKDMKVTFTNGKVSNVE